MSVYNRAISRDQQRVFGHEITNQPSFVTTNNNIKGGKKIVRASAEKMQQYIFSNSQQTFQNKAAEPYCPKNVEEYAGDIFTYLHNVEHIHPSYFCQNTDYMSSQDDISFKMRQILIDWLVDVHLKFRMLPETLFLCVNLIDRYLEKEQVQRNQLQLVGITALFISAKYEEIYPPHIKEYSDVTDKTYTKYDILKMESNILLNLSFNLTFPTSYRFFNRYAKILQFKSDERIFNLSEYLIQLILVENTCLKYKNSLIAAAALYLSQKIFLKGKDNVFWCSKMEMETKYTETEVRKCAKDLCLILQNTNNSNLQAVKKKFASKKFNSISLIQIQTNNKE